MGDNTLYGGFVLSDARRIPLKDDSVQCVVTSPPYYGLRDYGVDSQIGLEESPEEYMSNLVTVFMEVHRVLKPDGVLWLNIGDAYARSGRGGSEDKQYTNTGSVKISHGLKNKDLMMIPHRVAIVLQQMGWYVRLDVVWNKLNAMPDSATDRPTLSHEYIFLMSKSADYYYDYEAVLEPYLTPLGRWGGDTLEESECHKYNSGSPDKGGKGLFRRRLIRPNEKGRNRRSVWSVNTKPYKGAHFATYPVDLIEPCILAGSRPGDLVLDPFSGSGTTAEVCIKHGRSFVGLELNPKYIELSKDRISRASTMVF